MAVLAIGTLAVGAATLANNIYQQSQSPSQPQGYGQFATGSSSGQASVKETPQEQAFYEQQTLQAEQAANAQADADQTAANSTFEITSYLKWALLGIAVFVGYRVLKKDKII